MKTALEPVIFKWKQFDGMDFSLRRGEYRSAIGKSGEDFDAARAKKTSKPNQGYSLMLDRKLQSPELGLSRSRQRHARLTVLAPRRVAFLVRSGNIGVHTIPFEDDRL